MNNLSITSGIKVQVIKEICALAKKYDINKVILFGSRARGDYKRTSDIDLAVTGGNINEFTIDIDEQTSTLLEFDIINLDRSVQDELKKSIDQEGKLLYEKI